MLAAGTASQFKQEPVGSWLVEQNFLVWNHDPSLGGVTIWGHPTEPAMETLFGIVDAYHRVCPSFDVVTDVSRVESIVESAYLAALKGMQARLSVYSGRVRRHALVRGGGLIGGLIEGFFPMIGADHNWRVFTSMADAFTWLGRPEAESTRLQIERIAEESNGIPPRVRQVREFLRLKLGGARVLAQDLARALGVSERTLHRSLQELGTGFRDELRAARIDVASQLLAETDLKIEAIARRVGCRSHAHLTSLFHRAIGVTPSQYRSRTALHREHEGEP